MVLSLEQIQELLKSPKNKAAIQDAVNHEARIQLHTKAVDNKHKASPYFVEFLAWVKNGIKLPADKYAAFEGMCQFPLATTALCNTIFDEYEKIFTAQDSYFDIEMLDDSMKEELTEYLKTVNVNEYFRTKGFEEYKKQPASIYVVDMPAMQTGPRPRPYFSKIAIQSVWDIAEEKLPDGKTRIGYLIHKPDAKTFVVLDDAAYWKFVREDNGDDRLEVYAPHILGYCPATFLVRTSLYDAEDNSPVARKVPISDSLGDLDWLLAYKIFERMYEVYGPFPINTVPESNCNYVDALNNPCHSGYVTGIDQEGKTYEHECPVCAKRSIVGPGTVFTLPIPNGPEMPVLKDPVTITPADVESLDYITKKIDYLEREIFANNVGDSDQNITKEAINQDQVLMNMEGRRSVLQKIKKDFELTEKFLIDTMGRLMYGDYYIGAQVNYGEQFLLLSADEVVLQYTAYKKAGLPNYMINQKKKRLIQTEYRTNAYEQQRALLLDRLEPWPDLSISECVTFQLDKLFPDKFFLKLDFAKFVSKFEIANADIVQWGSAISLDQKIKKLTEILINYGKEESTSAKPLPESKPGGSATK